MSGLRAKPTKEMLEWHDYELGVFFHYDIEVFQPEYSFGEDLIPASKWNPVKLDTDQWVRTAKAAGARYALITAKHGQVFACGLPGSMIIMLEMHPLQGMLWENLLIPAENTE